MPNVGSAVPARSIHKNEYGTGHVLVPTTTSTGVVGGSMVGMQNDRGNLLIPEYIIESCSSL
jgi:hypothetical protein